MTYLQSNEDEIPEHPGIVAGIAAHDDYLYSARINYPLFKNIKTGEVVIFGVTHSAVRKRIGDPQGKLIFDEYSFWSGVTGKVKISNLRQYLIHKIKKDHVLVSNLAHQLEHSIEGMIPFLQYYNPELSITPIMITGMPFEKMAEIADELADLLADYIKKKKLRLGKDIFFLISSDANHYGKAFSNTKFGMDEKGHQLAIDLDLNIIRSYLTGEININKIKNLTKQLWGKTYQEYKNTLWCGKFSIPFGLLTITKTVAKLYKNHHLKGKLFAYSDTYSEGVIPLKKPGFGITAPFSLQHWVGFFSAGFYLEKNK
jgi:AmmeMemoRadiSam system protein B